MKGTIDTISQTSCLSLAARLFDFYSIHPALTLLGRVLFQARGLFSPKGSFRPMAEILGAG
jgi:hypothetical protein